MIKLYGQQRSSAGRCFWALEEIGVPYEVVALDFKTKEHKHEEYLKLNPNGKVPTLVDGAFVLWESYAINNYLAATYKPELLGRSKEERALIDQWTFWSALHLQSHIEVVMYFDMFQVGTSEGVERAKATLVPFLAILDAHLMGRAYVVGDAFTVADINLDSVIGMALHVKIDLSFYANILAWHEQLQTREAVVRLRQK